MEKSIKYRTTFSALQWKVMLFKRYFDYGFGMTNYFKYFLYIFTANEILRTKNIKFSIAILLIWGVASLIIGWSLYRWGWYAAEVEVTNRVNPFVYDVRKNLNTRLGLKK